VGSNLPTGRGGGEGVGGKECCPLDHFLYIHVAFIDLDFYVDYNVHSAKHEICFISFSLFHLRRFAFTDLSCVDGTCSRGWHAEAGYCVG